MKKTPKKIDTKTKLHFIDEEERELIESIEGKSLKKSANQKALIEQLKKASTYYRQKNARINIRMSDSDLLMLKQQAAMQGLPYQTLVSSILHQYVAGHLKSAY